MSEPKKWVYLPNGYQADTKDTRAERPGAYSKYYHESVCQSLERELESVTECLIAEQKMRESADCAVRATDERWRKAQDQLLNIFEEQQALLNKLAEALEFYIRTGDTRYNDRDSNGDGFEGDLAVEALSALAEYRERIKKE